MLLLLYYYTYLVIMRICICENAFSSSFACGRTVAKWHSGQDNALKPKILHLCILKCIQREVVNPYENKKEISVDGKETVKEMSLFILPVFTNACQIGPGFQPSNCNCSSPTPIQPSNCSSPPLSFFSPSGGETFWCLFWTERFCCLFLAIRKSRCVLCRPAPRRSD